MDSLVLIAVVLTVLIAAPSVLRGRNGRLASTVGMVLVLWVLGAFLDATGIVGAAVWALALACRAVGGLLAHVARTDRTDRALNFFSRLAWSGGTVLLVSGLPSVVMPTGVPVHASFAERVHLLAAADQADRRSGAFLLDTSRDEARRASLRDLLAETPRSDTATAEAAALILVHGDCAADFQLAIQVLDAAPMLTGEGERLYRIAEDRWLMARGQRQRHGTQIAFSAGSGCPP